MNSLIANELDHNRKRLDYYSKLKEKGVNTAATHKWIEIFSERTKKLERQLQKIEKLGLTSLTSRSADKKSAESKRA